MQWGYEHITESTKDGLFQYNDKARIAAAQAIETWLACGAGEDTSIGGRPFYARSAASQCIRDIATDVHAGGKS